MKSVVKGWHQVGGTEYTVASYFSVLCFLNLGPFSFMNVSFTGSHILLQHFHLLCLWGFDPQYSS